MSEGGKTSPPEGLAGADDAIFPPEDEITAEYAEPPLADDVPEPPPSGFSHDEAPTIERIVPAALLATRREEEFRTVHVTFSEILQRVGPQHLGGPLPPIRDDLYTTEGTVSEEPASTTDLDSEWNEETQKG